jgi:pleckstrin homology domain-containing family G member 1/2/3
MLVEHLPGDPTSFHVLPFSDPRNQIKLTAKNRDQKRLWAQQIKQAMLEHFDIPSRAKELVFKLGDEEGEWKKTYQSMNGL